MASQCAHIIAPPLVKIFKLVFDSGLIPESWTLGMIKPIYKNKGCKSDPANYRPITLISCLGKLFTSILNERLQKMQMNIILQIVAKQALERIQHSGQHFYTT